LPVGPPFITGRRGMRVLLSVGHDANDHNLLLKGAPL
jgi:hypothetical protein